MSLDRQSPIWSIAPACAVFSVFLLTDARTPPFCSRRRKDKSRIDQNSFDLCGIAAIGDILSSGGGLSFILSQSTRRACFVCTFSSASALKCFIAAGERAERWGPRATASHISSFYHGFPCMLGIQTAPTRPIPLLLGVLTPSLMGT